MEKTKRLIALIVAISMVAVAVTVFAACGGRKIDGTFKIDYDKEYVSTNMAQFEGGAAMFLTMAEAYSSNTLVMKEDGTYSYTKDLQGPALGLALTVTFTGEYEDGTTEHGGTTENSYILNKPTGASWTFTPGMTVIAGWGNGTSYSEDYAEHMNDKYEGDLDTDIYVGAPATAFKAVDCFLGPTLLFASTEGMTDEELTVEVALADGAIVYLADAE